MRRRSVLSVFVAVTSLALVPLSAAPSLAEGKEAPPVSGLERGRQVTTGATRTMIVTFDAGQSDPAAAARQAAASAAGQVAGATVTKVAPITDTTVAITLSTTLDATEQAAVGSRIESVAGVKAAEPAARFTTASTNDTYYDYLWNLNSAGSYGIDAEDAWPISTGKGAVVGVVDTGITAHSDLTGSSSSITGGNIVAGYDFISDPTTAGDGGGRDANPTDTGDYCQGEDSSWHGTHVTGTIAAIGNNNEGVVGAAPDAKVQPLRVLGRCGGDEADVIAAIRWGAGLSVSGISAVNPTPDDVLNLSLGTTESCSTAMQAAINAAVAAGTVVVVAAGNDATSLATSSPANCDNVIAVTASTSTGTLASYSNYGTSASPATVAAPGGSGTSSAGSDDLSGFIVFTWNNGARTVGSESYTAMAGTSMAAPHVSATAALLKSMDSSLTPARIASIIADSARSFSSSCASTRCGAGIVDAAVAVKAEATSLASELTVTTSGTARVGRTLTAETGTWRSSPTFSYQWLRNGVAISKATKASYTMGSADYKAALSVRVTGTAGGVSATALSARVSVAAGQFTVRAPKVSGTFTVGHTVRASQGSWSPSLTKTGYRWLRSGASIAGATKSSYKLVKADKGKKVSVRVTGQRTAYATMTATSGSKKVA